MVYVIDYSALISQKESYILRRKRDPYVSLSQSRLMMTQYTNEHLLYQPFRIYVRDCSAQSHKTTMELRFFFSPTMTS